MTKTKKKRPVQAIVKFLLEDDNPADESKPQELFYDKAEVSSCVRKIVNRSKQRQTASHKQSQKH